MKSKELWNEQKGLFILYVFLIKFRSALHLWVVWACMLEWVAIIDFKKSVTFLWMLIFLFWKESTLNKSLKVLRSLNFVGLMTVRLAAWVN